MLNNSYRSGVGKLSSDLLWQYLKSKLIATPGLEKAHRKIKQEMI